MAVEIIKSLEEFRDADQATRDYYVYSKLSGLADLSFSALDRRYSKIWVQRFILGAGFILGAAGLNSLARLIIR